MDKTIAQQTGLFFVRWKNPRFGHDGALSARRTLDGAIALAAAFRKANPNHQTRLVVPNLSEDGRAQGRHLTEWE